MTHLSADTVRRRFPPLSLIDSRTIRLDTGRALSEGTPEYFWTVPAASSYKHHNPYCCGERGLWVHTLMVSTVYERLVGSWVAQDRLTEREADLGRAACLLHDLRKHGESYTEGDSADRDHDLQAARFVREFTDLPSPVADAVASHMGSWYEGPAPETPLQRLVHQADMIAASKNVTPGIYHKPAEIAELYPSLPGADL